MKKKIKHLSDEKFDTKIKKKGIEAKKTNNLNFRPNGKYEHAILNKHGLYLGKLWFINKEWKLVSSDMLNKENIKQIMEKIEELENESRI